MKKAALHNLGCKVNSYETEAMSQLLEAGGYEIVPFSERADVYVINTCSVTNMADRKSRQMLHRARKMNPDGIVVAAGCYVQTSPEQARQDAAVDILIGNNQKHELLHLIEAYAARREELSAHEAQQERMIDINEKTEYEAMSIDRTSEHTRAFLKVQDGCNQFCSYCIIPYARGRVRSRDLEDVLREVRMLAEGGCKEVVLTGIHLSSYGVDNGSHLLQLTERVHEIKGIHRIRLGSLEPGIITDEFVKKTASLKKVCPHFHLSLQSGCGATLKRMNRRYTCEEYKMGCELLRSYYEHPAITTDVIVGFPGETEDEFETTRRFLKEIAFFEAHIFKFSPRKGTKAAEMEHQVPEEVKHSRSSILLRETEEMSQSFVDWYQGKKVEVLMEEQIEIDGCRYFVGHTAEYVKTALPEGENLENKLIFARGCERFSDHILKLDKGSLENID